MERHDSEDREEFSAEVAPQRILTDDVEQSDEGANVAAGRSRIVGYVALALAALSLFVYPLLFGATAVVVGMVAYAGGSKALGGWSVGIGLVSFFAYLFLAPIAS